MSDHPEAARRVRAYAHRGGTEVAPENTMASFAHAWSLGYVDLETDVRATRDGVAVVMHDATLDRTTDRSGTIRDMTWADVARARVGGTEGVPRLDDLLGAFPLARVNLDVKESAAIAPLADAVRRAGAERRVCITSFSRSRLRAARRCLPVGVATAAHPPEVLRAMLLVRAGRPVTFGPGVRLQVPLRVLGEPGRLRTDLLSAARAAGIPVDVWTVNDRPTMETLLDRGVDGIMTDRPVLLREVLLERGRWDPQRTSAEKQDPA